MKMQPLTTLAVVLLFLTGCGEGDTAPDGSTVSVNPTTRSWATGADPTCLAGYNYDLSPVTISVRSARGRPIPGVTVDLSLALSSGTTAPGTEVVELYSGYVTDQQIANGEVTALPSPTRLSTNDAGVIELSVLMWMGCSLEYRSTLTATSGSAAGTSSFEVTVEG